MTVRRRAVALLVLLVVATLGGAAIRLSLQDEGRRSVAEIPTSEPPPPPQPARAPSQEPPPVAVTVTSAAPPRDPGADSKELPLRRLRVLAEEDDSPIAGAVVLGPAWWLEVTAPSRDGVRAPSVGRNPQKASPTRFATTDADGRCSFRAPRDWRLAVVCEPDRWPLLVDPPDGTTEETVVWMTRPARVRGQVRGAEGAPVRQALVNLNLASMDSTLAGSGCAWESEPDWFVTDSEGRFSFDVPRGVLLEADAYAPGDVPGAAWALVRVPLDREEEELHLTLRARVRDVPRVVRAAMTSTGEIALARIRWELVAEGADAAPCYVQVQWVPSGDAGIDLRWSAVAGREGFLASVPAGRGRIRLETAGPSLLLERDLELTAGETEDLGRIAVPSLRTVLVRVAGRADLEASPEFAWIRADGEQSWVAARAVRKDGAYPLSLPGGDGVRLFVRVRGVGSAVTDVLPRRGDVDVGTLTLRPEGRIRATVLSETGRSPGRVTTWRAAPDVLRFEDHEVAADGRFAAMLPAGRVRIIIRSEDLGTCEQDVEILPGRTTEATFRLKQ